MSKNKKIKNMDKDTRRHLEATSDMLKKKGERFKFKSGKGNKKTVKKLRKLCMHWMIRKGKPIPTVQDDGHGNWECYLCHAKFPILPKTEEEYDQIITQALEAVNQVVFLAVHLGGDSEDIKSFLRLKEDLPKFRKIAREVIKQSNKRQQFEANSEDDTIMNQFSQYGGIQYNLGKK